MTFSAIQVETPRPSLRYVDALSTGRFLSTSVEFLDRHIDQLMIEKDLLQRNATSCITMLDLHIQRLALERDLLARRAPVYAGTPDLSETWQADFSGVPMVSITQFLTAPDVARLRQTCCKVNEGCSVDGRSLVIHLNTPSQAMDINEAIELLNQICLPMVESLFIEAKKPAGKSIMAALALNGPRMTSLRTLRVSAAAETGDFQIDLKRFVGTLPRNQIRSIHLSGLRSVALVAELITCQSESIEKFKVDYFVNGHEGDIAHIPCMPRLRSFVFDVADVVHLPVALITELLNSIKNKEAVEAIYMPHMQISGQSHQIVEFIELLKQFRRITQLVVRFRRLPLSVKEIVDLREVFEHLPAVCISDHFIVMLDCWAAWWPKQTAIWPSPEKITGLSVFREQIDFESLGTTANREWLRLSREQKNLWSRRIAANVIKLYFKQTA